MPHPAPDAYTILAVDDDRDTLDLLRAQFERRGYRVLTAQSAEEALEVFLASEVHLLVIDYVMPGMDGAQLVRAIRGFDPLIQIIIQTAHAKDCPSQKVLDELEIQGYHDKSDGPQRLMAWVTVCLRAQRVIHELGERERLQRELLSNLSHEFRAPLNIAHGYASMLLEQTFGPLPVDAFAPLRAIEENARTLSNLIDNVLEHTRLEAGIAEVSLGGVDVGPLLDELERLGGSLLQQKPVTLTVHVDPDLPIVESDTQKVRTILRNLFSNAIKFTSQGTIDVRAVRRGDDVVVTVRDSGIGIDGHELEALFEPFRQGDGSSTRRHGGLGIGLALSRKYARLLGGDLTVESEFGRGTMVTLVIPGVAGVASLSLDPPPPRVRAAAAYRSVAAPPATMPSWLSSVAGLSIADSVRWALGMLERLTPAGPA
jgi:signal transduction histidine kinase